MLTIFSTSRNALVSRVARAVKSQKRPITQQKSQRPFLRNYDLLSNRQYHVTSKLFQIPSKRGENAVSEDSSDKVSGGVDKGGLSGKPLKSGGSEVGDASVEPSKAVTESKASEETNAATETSVSAPKEEETDLQEFRSLTAVPSLFASQLAGNTRRMTRKRTSTKPVRTSAGKGLSSFFEVGGYTASEVEALLHLRVHIHGLISSLCTNPRAVSLASFPSLGHLEQQQIDNALTTLFDEHIMRVLELEAFSHLTSTPMSSLMAKGRTAMFNQIGFTLKAPSDHEAYVLHTIQQLALKFNAQVIDFDFQLLRQSQSYFTESLLQAGTSEETSINMNELFSEMVREDSDFLLFFEVLFEIIQKQASLAQMPHLRAQNNLSDIPTEENAKHNDKEVPTFVVVLRGLERLRSFPYRQFKELLRSCRAHVLFLEVELSNAQAGNMQPIGMMLSPSNTSFMIAPQMNEEEDAEGGVPMSIRQIFDRMSSAATQNNRKTASTGYFLNTDPINMTNRAILEAESRKLEDMKHNEGANGGRGMGGFLARITAEAAPSSSNSATSSKPLNPGEPSLASVLAEAETAQIALSTVARRANLQYNLKQLSACIRAMHVVLIPNREHTLPEGCVVVGQPSETADPALDATSVSETSSTVSDETNTSAKAIVNVPKQISKTYSALLNPIIPRARLSSKHAPPHPSIPVFESNMQCLTEYWLNPLSSEPKPDSFELTCLLLSTTTEPLTQVYRIIRQAIKLQDMHQYRASGTWNHFSPMAGMLVRVGSIEAALESALLDGVSPYSEEQLQAVSEQEARNEPLIKMPLEVRFLHEALFMELEVGQKARPVTVRTNDMECNDEKMLPLVKRVYGRLSAQFPAPRILKEGEYDTKKSYEEQKAREREDESYLQSRLAGLKLNANEKSMLQNYVAPSRLETTFDDIGSLEHAKEELLSLIVPMSLPVFHKENRLIKTPLGILLYGPPGTGKTMLAKALAKTANASFIHISASTIISKWLGDSEGHAAAVFSLARKISPCLVFIDEVDGLLHSRDTSEHETSRRVKNEFFSGWDGLLSDSNDPNMSVTVIAATNRPFDLDNAALRRLPHRVLVNLPDQKARIEILNKTLKDVFVAPATASADAKPSDITEEDRNKVIEELATLTEGYSGSDLKSICTRAAQQHVRDFMKSQDMTEILKRRKTVSTTDPLDEEGNAGDQEHENPYLEAARTYARRPITMKEFNLALSEITASVNQRSGSSMELKKWHETYGSKPSGQRANSRATSLGF